MEASYGRFFTKTMGDSDMRQGDKKPGVNLSRSSYTYTNAPHVEPKKVQIDFLRSNLIKDKNLMTKNRRFVHN